MEKSGQPNNVLQLQAKHVYGRDILYPGCERSKVFAEIANTRTITDSTLKLMQKLGFECIITGYRGRYAA